jgi:hypothetical protein
MEPVYRHSGDRRDVATPGKTPIFTITRINLDQRSLHPILIGREDSNSSSQPRRVASLTATVYSVGVYNCTVACSVIGLIYLCYAGWIRTPFGTFRIPAA